MVKTVPCMDCRLRGKIFLPPHPESYAVARLTVCPSCKGTLERPENDESITSLSGELAESIAAIKEPLEPPYCVDVAKLANAVNIIEAALSELAARRAGTWEGGKRISEAELKAEMMEKSWKEVPMGGAYLITVDDAVVVASKYAEESKK